MTEKRAQKILKNGGMLDAYKCKLKFSNILKYYIRCDGEYL